IGSRTAEQLETLPANFIRHERHGNAAGGSAAAIANDPSDRAALQANDNFQRPIGRTVQAKPIVENINVSQARGFHIGVRCEWRDIENVAAATDVSQFERPRTGGGYLRR